MRFWGKGEQRVGSAGVLARNNVSCKGRGTGILPVFRGFIFDMINMIWRASVPTSRFPLCGRMVSGFIAERRGGRALLVRAASHAATRARCPCHTARHQPCATKGQVFCAFFGTQESGKRFGVRRQAVFRATPLFEQECGGRATRESGAAARAQRGSRHRKKSSEPAP